MWLSEGSGTCLRSLIELTDMLEVHGKMQMWSHRAGKVDLGCQGRPDSLELVFPCKTQEKRKNGQEKQ